MGKFLIKDLKKKKKKRLKIIGDKNGKELKVIKDQLEKQPIKRKVKNPNFNIEFFRNLLDDKSMNFFDEIRYPDEIIDYSQPNFIRSSKKYTFNSEKFMSLGNLAKNNYNGNVSLDAPKQEQKKKKKKKKWKMCLKVLLITI